ncbi:MAG: hypothetical protein SV775_10215, partial [Thermodesulfobacteriota bacterium]|nr:hypothetical protein [Thermodesulfobacteriota bacterium]
MKSREGSVVVGLIVTMVLLSALAAAMLAQTSTGSIGLVNENSSTRAYYMAESGFRYASAKLDHSGHSALNSLHDHGSFSLGDHGSFTLEFKTYVFDITGGDGTTELAAKVPFGDAPTLPAAAGLGKSFYAKIGDGAVEAFDTISVDAPPNEDIVRFTKTIGTWSAPTGERASLVVKSNGDAVSEGGDFNLKAESPADAFPPYNGYVVADGKTYSYKRRETDKLVGIFIVDDTVWQTPSLNDGDDIALQGLTELHSSGSYGVGDMETSREIVYHIPLSTAEKTEFVERDWGNVGDTSNLPHWEDSSLGSHEVQMIGGDSALRVTGTGAAGSDSGSLISFDWG